MDPTIVLAVVSGAATTFLAAAIAFLSLAWQIGRWQGQSEKRADAMKTKLDDFITRADRDIAKAHDRIDDILKVGS